MASAHGRAEVPERFVDDGEPIVQEREAPLVEVGIPTDSTLRGMGLVLVEGLRKCVSQSFSRCSTEVASASQQTNVPSLAGRQRRPEDPCADCVEMRVETKMRTSAAMTAASNMTSFSGVPALCAACRPRIWYRVGKQEWSMFSIPFRYSIEGHSSLGSSDLSGNRATRVRSSALTAGNRDYSSERRELLLDGRDILGLRRFRRRPVAYPTNRKGSASAARMPDTRNDRRRIGQSDNNSGAFAQRVQGISGEPDGAVNESGNGHAPEVGRWQGPV